MYLYKKAYDILTAMIGNEICLFHPLINCSTVHIILTGSFQRMHGDEAQISQSSVCRVIKHVSDALASRRRQFMKFPTTRQEIASTQQQFYQYCRFPGVLGAIDGTHVYIRTQSPGGDQPMYFLNRKNIYSINVQVR